MARSRNIKPGFFKNEHLADCSMAARLLYVGLWTLADREGRMEDRPKRIGAEIFPFDNLNADILLSELHTQGLIRRYTIDTASYLDIPKFPLHQHPHPNESPSVIPAFVENSPVHEMVGSAHEKALSTQASYLLPITSYLIPHPKDKSTVKRDKAATFEELMELGECLRLHDDEFKIFASGIVRYCNSKGFHWEPKTKSIEQDIRALVYRWTDEQKLKFLTDAANALSGLRNWPLFLFRAVQHMIVSSKKTRIRFPLLWLQSVLMQNPMQIISSVSDGPLSRTRAKR